MDQASTLREMVNRRRGDDYPVNHGQDLINADFRTIAVTSGKGGVGKTNVVANLAYQLTRIGKKVIILDADLGFFAHESPQILWFHAQLPAVQPNQICSLRSDNFDFGNPLFKILNQEFQIPLQIL